MEELKLKHLDYFDLYLHYKGRNNEKVFSINIGAMDGVLFDELVGYSKMYNFKGLYVEPVPYLFDKLKNNFDQSNLFENSAISNYDGEVEMIMIDPKPIDQKLIHKCFYGMSAITPAKNGLGSEFDKKTVEKYGKKIKVPCITFDTLIKKHNITEFQVLKIDAEGHDFIIFDSIDLTKYSPDLIRLEYKNLEEKEKEILRNKLTSNGYIFNFVGLDIVGIKKEIAELIIEKPTEESKVTIVTGIWDIKREELTEGWSRKFEHYLNNLEKLFKCENNIIVFIPPEYKEFVEKKRSTKNTFIIERDVEWFKNNIYFSKIQTIRQNPKWYNQAGWLAESTQAKLEMYNPIVMSKMFLLNDARILDPFNSTHLVWVDGALTNTVHEGYFWKDKVISKLNKYFNKFSFVCFPYDGKVEIHGFEYKAMCEYSENNVDKVARGGIFGGPKDSIEKLNSIYYALLNESLDKGLMGTEESIFTIMTYKHPELIQYYEISSNGLLGKFFEDLKNDTLIPKQESSKAISTHNHDINNTALYVLTYNSPNQFEKLCISFKEYDIDFLNKPKKFLLNNSLDKSTDLKYEELCKKYGFEEIKKDNLGICGGRQFISEHADKNNFDYHFFFEDDMFFYLGKDEFCKNGFRRKIKNFYSLMMEIASKENFDYLKWNFTEFYGDNTRQWAWYNVPDEFRKNHFPEHPTKSKNDQGKEPFAIYKNIKSHKGLPYASGEIYYCNWPQVVSKEGNKKMFLDTKWEYPYEQTWMSYIFQETIKGNINPGILLTSPTEHDRFEFYPSKERREN